MCLIAEIIHTCSHERVAQAAVASVGSDFASKVGAQAGACGLSIGAFTARAVREFEKHVGEPEKQALRAIMDRADQPLLIGLRHILLPMIETDGSALEKLNFMPSAASRPSQKRSPAKASRSLSETPSV